MNKKRYIVALISMASILMLATIFFISNQGNKAKKIETSPSATTTKSSKEVKTESYPEGQLSDWNLDLVNSDHAYTNLSPVIVISNNGEGVLDKIEEPTSALFNAALSDGIELHLVSGYRSIEYQERIVQSVTAQNIAEGMSEEEAQAAAFSVLTQPGHSEHHTGLAIDIVDESYFNNHQGDLLTEAYESEASAQWLVKNAPNYGFILRYPKGKTAITKINFEPWHYRYVGIEHAKFITSHGLTLEEYLEQLQKEGR